MIKRTKSKDLLAQSIEQLAASKSVNKIRIKDITENCGLTSPMFYYYYKDADDIINYIFRTDFEKKLENGPDRMDYAWLLHQLADLLREKYGFYQNVLQNTHGVNSLYNTSASVILEYIREKMRADFENGETSFADDLENTIRKIADSLYKGVILYQISNSHLIYIARMSINPDYKERSLGWLHSQLGYVLQSPHLSPPDR